MDREEIIDELNRIDFMARYRDMPEEELERKTELIVALAKNMICSFFNDYISPEESKKAQELLDQIPIELNDLPKKTNAFGKDISTGGYVGSDGIVHLKKDQVKRCDSKNPYAMDELLSTLIHEYCHALRKHQQKDSKGYFEEGFADFFAETCISYSRLKSNRENLIYLMEGSLEYERASRQLKSIIFCLKEQGKDMEAMDEFLLGDDNKFLEICTDVFGPEFENYFNQVNTININVNYAQDALVNMISKLIEEKKIDLNNLPKDQTQLSPDSLFFVPSYFFIKSMENVGEITSVEKFIKNRVEETDNAYDSKRDNRIKRYIENRYSLEDKNEEEVYETLIYLASDYIQRKGLTDEENVIFLRELKERIPFVEDFAELFRELRVERKDTQILDNLDLEDINYEKIYSKMQTMKPKEELSPEEQRKNDLEEMLKTDDHVVKSNDKKY